MADKHETSEIGEPSLFYSTNLARAELAREENDIVRSISMLGPSIAFQNYQVLTYKTLHSILYCQQIGTLSLPSGELVEGDPLRDWHEEGALDHIFPPGLYPVFVTTMLDDRGLDIAFTAIRFTQTEPVRWELVHGRNQQGQPLGYGVDCGVGSLMDRTTKDILYNLFECEEFSDILFGRSSNGSAWGEYHVPEHPEANLFYFWTDDGGNPSYYGYDAQGTITCIVTDFFGLEDEGWTLWPASLPPIPAGFDEHFFSWLGEMNAVLKYPGAWDRREPLAPDDLHFLEQAQTAVIPSDLRRYYMHSGFWLNGEKPLQQWWPPLEKQVREALQTNKPLLPVSQGWKAVAVCDQENHYLIALPPEPGHSNDAIEYPDLKTYLMSRILRDLGAISG